MNNNEILKYHFFEILAYIRDYGVEELYEYFGQDDIINGIYKLLNTLDTELLIEIIWHLITEHLEYGIEDIADLLDFDLDKWCLN